MLFLGCLGYTFVSRRLSPMMDVFAGTYNGLFSSYEPLSMYTVTPPLGCSSSAFSTVLTAVDQDRPSLESSPSAFTCTLVELKLFSTVVATVRSDRPPTNVSFVISTLPDAALNVMSFKSAFKLNDSFRIDFGIDLSSDEKKIDQLLLVMANVMARTVWTGLTLSLYFIFCSRLYP